MGGRPRTDTIDNYWVVPYTPVSIRRFGCHINAELCISLVGGIKYLFKYICKGGDILNVGFLEENERYDEIDQFVDSRFLSSIEANWRLLGYDIIKRSPPVMRLDVHVENYHTVYYAEDEAAEAARRQRPGTKITEWVKANTEYPSAQHHLYEEFAQCFIWEKRRKVWKPRARTRIRGASEAAASSSANTEVDTTMLYDFTGTPDKMVSRIYTVSPREGERYYLRTLQLHQPGETCYEYLRTVDCVEFGSFLEACNAMGQLRDDSEWHRALAEAFRDSFEALSSLFATILVFCSPSNQRNLWTKTLRSSSLIFGTGIGETVLRRGCFEMMSTRSIMCFMR